MNYNKNNNDNNPWGSGGGNNPWGSGGGSNNIDFEDSIKRLGKDIVAARYGNLFAMYDKITGDDPYTNPMKIFPAVHYTMGGLWVDNDLMTTIPGHYAIGE